VGEFIEPLGGGVVGGAIGSEFGVGLTGSYVPSTGSSYAGVTANFTPAPNGALSIERVLQYRRRVAEEFERLTAEGSADRQCF
jgi:hypothetical protein